MILKSNLTHRKLSSYVGKIRPKTPPFQTAQQLSCLPVLFFFHFIASRSFCKIRCFTRNHSWVRSSFFRKRTKAAVVRNCALCFCIRGRVTDFFSKLWSPRVNCVYFMTIFLYGRLLLWVHLEVYFYVMKITSSKVYFSKKGVSINLNNFFL